MRGFVFFVDKNQIFHDQPRERATYVVGETLPGLGHPRHIVNRANTRNMQAMRVQVGIDVRVIEERQVIKAVHDVTFSD
jgi:hypothetical protein